MTASWSSTTSRECEAPAVIDETWWRALGMYSSVGTEAMRSSLPSPSTNSTPGFRGTQDVCLMLSSPFGRGSGGGESERPEVDHAPILSQRARANVGDGCSHTGSLV